MRPKPSCDQRTATTPKPSRTRLRTAWTATCGSSAQAWRQRSPPLRAGSSRSPVKAGRSSSACRATVGEAEAVVEERGPEADRHGQPRRWQAVGLPRVLGHPARATTDEPAGSGLSAERHPLGGAGPRLEQRDELGPIRRHDVERDEVEPVLRRCDDAGLVRPVEVHDRLGADRRGRRHRARRYRARPPGRIRRPRGGADPDDGGGRPGEDAAATRTLLQDHGIGHDATTPGTFATSSARASSATVRALTSAAVRSV